MCALRFTPAFRTPTHAPPTPSPRKARVKAIKSAPESVELFGIVSRCVGPFHAGRLSCALLGAR